MKLLSSVGGVRRVSRSSTSPVHMDDVKISVIPREALVDEPVHIKVDGLPNNRPVTIKASLQVGNNRFASYGCYTATEKGHVTVEEQASVQGTYTGFEPMGLFWSMKPEPSTRQNIRLLKKDVTTPMVVTLSVIEGHHSWETLFDPSSTPLATLDVYRWYKDKNVRRKRISDGNFRGALFIPPGPGPFPGVIDMFSSGGGLLDQRAALLASRGYCVFALPFFAYEDLPETMTDVSLDYLIESAKWFAGLPDVRSNGIGIIAISKSGIFALELCRHLPEIKAVVLVNGVTFYGDTPLKYSKGDIESTEFRFDRMKVTPDGIEISECQQPTDDFFIKGWESEATFLLIIGEDDRCLNYTTGEHFLELVPKEHKHRFQIIKYPKAGHLIEPPYGPHYRKAFHKVFQFDLLFGGETKAHSYAQEDSWRRILEFFSNQLKSNKQNSGSHLNTISKL